MEGVGLKLTSEDGVGDFLRVKIERKSDSEIHLPQPHPINSVLEDLNLLQGNGKEEVFTKDTPAAMSILLRRHLDSAPFDSSFDYRSVIGRHWQTELLGAVYSPRHCERSPSMHPFLQRPEMAAWKSC